MSKFKWWIGASTELIKKLLEKNSSVYKGFLLWNLGDNLSQASANKAYPHDENGPSEDPLHMYW